MNSNCAIKLSKIMEGQIFTTHVFHILSTCIPDDTGHSSFVHFSQVNHRCRRPGWATEKISRKQNYVVRFVVNATLIVDYFAYSCNLFIAPFINIVRRYLVLINVDNHTNKLTHFFLNVSTTLSIKDARCLLIARYFCPADDYARKVDVTKGY